MSARKNPTRIMQLGAEIQQAIQDMRHWEAEECRLGRLVPDAGPHHFPPEEYQRRRADGLYKLSLDRLCHLQESVSYYTAETLADCLIQIIQADQVVEELKQNEFSPAEEAALYKRLERLLGSIQLVLEGESGIDAASYGEDAPYYNPMDPHPPRYADRWGKS